jgi:hypothetical protein
VNARGKKRPKQVLARAERGAQVVILEFEAQAGVSEQPPGYEFTNRSKIEGISDTGFVVVETGRVLTRTMTA